MTWHLKISRASCKSFKNLAQGYGLRIGSGFPTEFLPRILKYIIYIFWQGLENKYAMNIDVFLRLQTY